MSRFAGTFVVGLERSTAIPANGSHIIVNRNESLAYDRHLLVFS